MEKELAERQGKTTVDVDPLGDKLSMIRTNALMDTLAYRVKQVDVKALW